MEMNDALTTKCTFLKTNGFALYNKISEACTLDSSNTGNRCFNLVFHSTNRGSKVTYSTTAMCHLRREAWPLHEHVCVCDPHHSLAATVGISFAAFLLSLLPGMHLILTCCFPRNDGVETSLIFLAVNRIPVANNWHLVAPACHNTIHL